MASPSNSTFEAACPSKWNSGALPGRHAERSRVISPFLGLTARPPPPTLRPSATHSAGIAFVTILRRSEEHTSELQSRGQLVCRLLLEKKKQNAAPRHARTTAGRGDRATQRAGRSPDG